MKKISLFLLLICSFLSAQNTDGIYRKLKDRYDSLSSFQADVTQNNHYSQLDYKLSYEGKLYYSPGRMLMSFDEPVVQRLYIHDGKAELFDGDSGLLFLSDIMPEFDHLNPLQILQLYWNKSEVTNLGDSGNMHSVKLVPTSDPHLQELKAKIEIATGIVRELSYLDKSGNEVIYSFSGIVLNRRIPPSVWNYDYPQDTQIIKQ